MGLWWKNVDTLPAEGNISFEGVPGAMSKKIPILWRFFQPKYVLELEKDMGEETYIFFASPGTKMLYREPVTTRHIVVRIGPEDVTFAATDDLGRVVRMKKIEWYDKAAWKNRKPFLTFI